MKFQQLHFHDLSPRDAVNLQNTLKSEVLRSNDFGIIRYVAGVDVSFEKGTAYAATVVLSFPNLEPQEYAISSAPVTFPLIPGLLSFREIPAVVASLEKLSSLPDLIMCDGQGIAHPRRFGIASHLGIITGIPSIGVAKTRLIGAHDEVGNEKGAWTPLTDNKGEIIGAALRTRKNAKPLYVSIGHKIDLDTAIAYVMATATKYRFPETTRWANRLASMKRATS